MKPLILYHYYGVIDGVFASIIDLYYNLLEYIDVDFSIVTIDPEKCIKHLFKNNNGDLVNKIVTENKFERDIIICSARLLYDEVCELECNKLIVLDSLDLSKSLYGVHPNIYQFIPVNLVKDDVVFLSNPANIMIDCIYSQIVYYQKLSKQRLESLPPYRGRFVDDYSLKMRFFYNTYDYRRTDKEYMEIKRNKYFENVGRSIFEHIYFGKKVYYYTDGMFMKDGLFYYLDLFGVNGMIRHSPLLITKEMVESILFMDENDVILDLIKDSSNVPSRTQTNS
jgi:hypothetical protein